ncbi:DMT family transporter [Marinobacteraceae bacterium S3BR75-40.1]
MSLVRLTVLTTLTMVAFAGNSVLCRAALKETDLDPASFTALRLISGALMLWFLLQWQRDRHPRAGHWRSAVALFVYAACLSFAYIGLSTGTGAILLFGAVQMTMVITGWLEGDRPSATQGAGFALAFAGLIGLVLPGIQAPPLGSALLMLASGVAWGFYSLWGRGTPKPLATTAGNFMRTVPMTLALSLIMLGHFHWDPLGATYAIVSGTLTSAVGYAIWYSVVPLLKAAKAASVQLSVPVIATTGGLVFLGEPLTLRFVITSAAILAGIGLVILGRPSN